MIRTISCVVAGIVAIIIVWATASAPKIAPKGIFLPVSDIPQKEIAVGSRVQFYGLGAAPAARQVLGYVNAEYHSTVPTISGSQTIQKFVAALAAKNGANGIISTEFYAGPPQNPKPLSVYVFRGHAIYAVPNVG